MKQFALMLVLGASVAQASQLLETQETQVDVEAPSASEAAMREEELLAEMSGSENLSDAEMKWAEVPQVSVDAVSEAKVAEVSADQRSESEDRD
ncbi:MAG: hypothetical protein GY849_15885 [Deltaproteobacteria bacterium]|nr:hypothetical protein [Deltaproteobacteria bacterium]